MNDVRDSAIGRVLRTSGGIYVVDVGGERLECMLRGRLKRRHDLGRVAVGDEVVLEPQTDGAFVITGVKERRSKISRRTAHGRREQIIATNIDRLGAVFATAMPDPVFPLLDRFLVLGEASDIEPFVVANKMDLTDEETARGMFGLYEKIGYQVLYTSAKSGANVPPLKELLANRTTLLAGPSGAGKSTLLNAIQPGLGLAVGKVSEALEKGKHTTVEASMHALDGGGYVVDTPGLRRLHIWEVGEHELGWCFREFRSYLGNCRFHNCRHLHEPECAIKQAVEAGRIDGRRYESYMRILGEKEEERSY